MSASKNQLLVSQDGSNSIQSGMFDVSYHSKYGAINESMTVFIDAGYHCPLFSNKKTIRILEMGFGTGLNPLLTLQHANKDDRKVSYVGVEAFPVDIDLVDTLNYAELIEGVSHENLLAMHGNNVDESIDGLELSDNFTFSKFIGKMQDFHSPAPFDVIYFDAFAPNAQPELWEEELLTKMYNLLGEEGALVTYCAKGVFKRTLKAIGFKLDMLPGPMGKREMTRALKTDNE